MKPISIKEVCSAVNGRLLGGDPATAIGSVSTNSKELVADAAFFALVARRDGHEFVSDAFASGASLAVVSKPVPVPDGKAAVLVADTLEALGQLASWYRSTMPATVIGITGSNGKTTTKEMLAHVLAGAAATVKSPGNFNNNIGVPHTLFQIEPSDSFAVVEMGTNARGEIRRLAVIARPQVGIITNISAAHLEGLANPRGVADEKSCLIEALPASGTAVLNADDFWSRRIASRTSARIITYGFDETADVRATAVQSLANGSRFDVMGTSFHLSILGGHNVCNALAAITAALNAGLDLELIRQRLATFRLPPMRMERITSGSIVILNDAYNANLESMLGAIREFSRLPVTGRKVMICGDMFELGEQSDEIHREIGRRIAAAGLHLVLAVGEQVRHVVRGAVAAGMTEQRIQHCPNLQAAQAVLPGILEKGDTVLLKASRRMQLELLVGTIESCNSTGRPAQTEAAEDIYHTVRATALQPMP